LWEAVRKAQEGLVAGCVESKEERDALLRFAATHHLDENERPLVGIFNSDYIPRQKDVEKIFNCNIFDTIIAYEPWRNLRQKDTEFTPQKMFFLFAQGLHPLLAKAGSVTLLQSPPELGERISRILEDECFAEKTLVEEVRSAETAFFCSTTLPFWNQNDLIEAWNISGYKTTVYQLEQNEERLLTQRDLTAWFDIEHSRWGKFIAQHLGYKQIKSVEALLTQRIKQGPVMWKWKSLLTRHDV
jgi:putative ATPase